LEDELIYSKPIAALGDELIGLELTAESLGLNALSNI
jgi:hypothetical protein